MPTLISVYQQHKIRWQLCTRCSLHLRRRNVVFARGIVPADVLFIGEGPGVSEDLLSIPFIGPAGKVLDSIITKAWELANVDTTYALYNIVSCVPKDEHGKKIHTPKEEAIIACSPKVKEFIELCSPSLIVCVGSIATTWILGTTKRTEKFALQDFKGTVLSIVHPAAILRMNISQRPLEIQKCVVAIVDSLEDL